MTSPPYPHPTFKELATVDWASTASILAGCTPVYEAITTNPALLNQLLNQLPTDTHLAPMCERYDFLDKLVLYDDTTAQIRVRLHLYRAGYFDRPHPHRWDFFAGIYRGSYLHRIFGRDTEFDEDTDPRTLRPLIERIERPGSTYALDHATVHTVQAEADTISILVRGPATSDRFLILDAVEGRSFWVYGAAHETAEQRAAKQMTTTQLGAAIDRARHLTSLAAGTRAATGATNTETPMSDDAMQGMLFGTVDTDADDHAGTDPGTTEIRVCALNVNSPNLQRAQRLADWLLKTRSNTLVLTEMQPSDGGRLIMSVLEAEGFTITCGSGWQESRYLTIIASRGFTVASVQPPAFDPRIIAVDLTASTTQTTQDDAAQNASHGQAGRTVRVIGVYGPTNGMTEESSQRRRDFQQRIIGYLTSISHPNMIVAGDLNVVEPGHRPHLPAFADHDYAFYTGLVDLGLTDAYRALQPTATDHSWISDRFGSQRLDHTLISASTGQITTCNYDHQPRTQQMSDHAALITTIQVTATQ